MFALVQKSLTGIEALEALAVHASGKPCPVCHHEDSVTHESDGVGTVAIACEACGTMTQAITNAEAFKGLIK